MTARLCEFSVGATESSGLAESGPFLRLNRTGAAAPKKITSFKEVIEGAASRKAAPVS